MSAGSFSVISFEFLCFAFVLRSPSVSVVYCNLVTVFFICYSEGDDESSYLRDFNARKKLPMEPRK